MNAMPLIPKETIMRTGLTKPTACAIVSFRLVPLRVMNFSVRAEA